MRAKPAIVVPHTLDHTCARTDAPATYMQKHNFETSHKPQVSKHVVLHTSLHTGVLFRSHLLVFFLCDVTGVATPNLRYIDAINSEFCETRAMFDCFSLLQMS